MRLLSRTIPLSLLLLLTATASQGRELEDSRGLEALEQRLARTPPEPAPMVNRS
jgi:hypothetical protein